MKLPELIQALTEFSDNDPNLNDLELEFVDRDNNLQAVKNVKLHFNFGCILVDLGGEYS